MSDDAERAQWEQASRVRAQRDAEAAARAEEAAVAVEATGDGAGRGRSRRRAVVAVAVGAVCVLAIGVVLVAIRHRADRQPAWVAQLGLESSGADASSSEDAAPTASVRGGTPASSSPTSSASGGATSTTAPDGAAARPPLINTSGEDFDQVWRQIEVLESWLLEHPQPGLAADIYVQGTQPYDDLVGQLSDLVAKDESGKVVGYQILGVTVDSRPSPDEVHLRYADTYTDRLTLDGSGAVIAHQPYDGRARLWTLTLHRGDDHRWRVSATSFLSFGDVVPPASS